MKVMVPVATGYEEIEFTTIVDVLRRAGIEAISAGLQEGAIEGAHGIKMLPDTTLDKALAGSFDALALPGGYPGYDNLGADSRVIKLVQKMTAENKLVTAICGAPSVLAKAGVLKGKKATIYPSMEGRLAGARCIDATLVIDGKIITSRGPATAMEFALKLVELLAGKAKLDEVRQGLLVK